MTDEIIMESKGITVELWKNAKGEYQHRIKVNMPLSSETPLTDAKLYTKQILDTIEELKNGLKERWGIE